MLSDMILGEIGETPTINADQFTGTIEEVANQMVGLATTVMDTGIAPLITAQKTLHSTAELAEGAYDTAKNAARIAKFATPKVALKLQKSAEQAKTYYEQLVTCEENLSKKVNAILVRVEDIKSKIRNVAKHSVQWIEAQINKATKWVQDHIKSIIEWLKRKLDAIEEKMMAKAKKQEEKYKQMVEERAREILEKQTTMKEGKSKRKSKNNKYTAEMPKTPL